MKKRAGLVVDPEATLVGDAGEVGCDEDGVDGNCLVGDVGDAIGDLPSSIESFGESIVESQLSQFTD